jgi:hypothetical protein
VGVSLDAGRNMPTVHVLYHPSPLSVYLGHLTSFFDLWNLTRTVFDLLLCLFLCWLVGYGHTSLCLGMVMETCTESVPGLIYSLSKVLVGFCQGRSGFCSRGLGDLPDSVGGRDDLGEV